MAIIVSKGGKGAKKIEKSGFEVEDYLQQYVYDNPESIPLTDIKEGVRLLVLAREFPTESGPIDVLGVDRDGDIYCIETKLFKNPDKRLVVAQVLDYGASLWHSYTDFGEFITLIDKHVAKVGGGSLSQRLKDFFGTDEAETEGLLDRIRENLSHGKFRFIVLMDKLHERLKDLVLFLNENSRFDIFAVEMDFYHHDGYEILIPKLFGAQVKKEVGSASRSGRRKWDETSFFEEAQRELDPQSLDAVKALYEFSKSKGASIGWGTGVTRGSYSPRFKKVAQRSVFSVYSDGVLSFNFGWLHDNENTEKYLDELARRLAMLPGIMIPSNYRTSYVNLDPEEWCPVVDGIMESLKHLIEDATRGQKAISQLPS